MKKKEKEIDFIGLIQIKRFNGRDVRYLIT